MPDSPRPERARGVSVRTRLIAVITIVAALGMVSVGFVVYLEERQRILAQVDSLLEANLDAARFLVEQGSPDTGIWEDERQALAAVVQRAAPDDNTGVIGLIGGGAALVPGVPLDVDLQTAPGFVSHVVDQLAEDSEPIIATYAEEGVTWRYLAAPIRIEGAPAGSAVFVIAYDIEAELAEINTAARVFALASAVTLGVIALAAALVTTRLLRPLRDMRRTAERVSARSLSERLPVQGRDDVSELAQTMNDMLDRLDGALDSQRRLLSDVGHELKTPITIVQGYLDVVDPENPDDVRETRDLVADELERMAQLVQDLASAAALHGPAPVKPVPVDVHDLMEQIVRKASAITGAQVEPGPLAHVVTAVDPARITQAMLQLAQNAVTHGGGRLVMYSEVREGMLQLCVRDFGTGVSDDLKPHVFERFTRADDAASAGSGLGLNIVQLIARAHGGTVAVHDAAGEGGGAVFAVSLPLTGTSPVPFEGMIPPRPPLPAPTEPAAAHRIPEETRWPRS